MRKLLVLSLAFVLGISFAAPLAAGKGASRELPFYGSFTGSGNPFNTALDYGLLLAETV
jgi:hypothetical protein